MEPMRPSKRAELLRRAGPNVVAEYEQCLALRAAANPMVAKAPAHLANERRLAELQRILFPDDEA